MLQANIVLKNFEKARSDLTKVSTAQCTCQDLYLIKGAVQSFCKHWLCLHFEIQKMELFNRLLTMFLFYSAVKLK